MVGSMEEGPEQRKTAHAVEDSEQGELREEPGMGMHQVTYAVTHLFQQTLPAPASSHDAP